LVNTKAPAALVEIEFHDSIEGATWIVNNKAAIAEAIAKGVCDFLGVQFKKPEPPKPQPQKVEGTGWRVCIGYYEQYDNAKTEVEKAKAAGFDAYMVPYQK
jgi:N-acetylmuramoyl-L-alanine amidase